MRLATQRDGASGASITLQTCVVQQLRQTEVVGVARAAACADEAAPVLKMLIME
jgi:hypothetical protein